MIKTIDKTDNKYLVVWRERRRVSNNLIIDQYHVRIVEAASENKAWEMIRLNYHLQDQDIINGRVTKLNDAYFEPNFEPIE